MPKRVPLDVWLYGVRVARLSEPSRFRFRLDFTEEALDLYGEGARVLSLSLPISREAIRDRDNSPRRVAAFIEGLLPEGNLRRHLATAEGVATNDSMTLLRRVGGECAGAVQFLPPGVAPMQGTVRMLTEEEVTRLVADLPTYHLPDGAYPQASLAGIQDKVLLVDLGDSWGWPEAGAPSTHLIKPEPLTGTIPFLVQSENWSLAIARAAGLDAAESSIQRFDMRDAIVVKRYDRDSDGRRLHQEDFCQALGLDPDAKYEASTESPARLRRLIALAAPRALDPDRLRLTLLSAVTFNVITGNGDAHSKNYSLLIGERGEVSLAPLYDTAPVMFIDPRFASSGHSINGQINIGRVQVDDLVKEAVAWGTSERAARATVTETIDRTHAAIATIPMPDGMAEAHARLETLWHRQGWSDQS
jgi:serine/threonine-protein kinase HipA